MDVDMYLSELIHGMYARGLHNYEDRKVIAISRISKEVSQEEGYAPK